MGADYQDGCRASQTEAPPLDQSSSSPKHPVARTKAVWITEAGVFRYRRTGVEHSEAAGEAKLRRFFNSDAYKQNLKGDSPVLLLHVARRRKGQGGHRSGGARRNQAPGVLRLQGTERWIQMLRRVSACGAAWAICLALPGPAFANGSEVRKSCAARGSSVELAAGRSRFYVLNGVGSVCRPGQRVRLGLMTLDEQLSRCTSLVSAVSLRPRFAVWGTDYQCDDQRIWSVRLADLRTGRVISDIATGRSRCAPRCPESGVGPAVRVAVSARGVPAWIAVPQGGGDPEVYLYANRTRSRLAQGSGISTKFLKVGLSAVHWREDGVVRTARFR